MMRLSSMLAGQRRADTLRCCATPARFARDEPPRSVPRARHVLRQTSGAPKPRQLWRAQARAVDSESMRGVADAAGPRSVCSAGRSARGASLQRHARPRPRRGALHVRADASPQGAVELSTVRSVNDVPAAEWCVRAPQACNCLRCRGAPRLTGYRNRDACASGRAEGGTNPFLSHGFMRALEDSGSVAPQRGWGVTHLLARDTAGTLLGVAPLYVKGHSYGYAAFS